MKGKRYSRKFQRMAVERMRNCEDVGELAQELGVTRRCLYKWRTKLEVVESIASEHAYSFLPEGNPPTKEAAGRENQGSGFFQRCLAKNRGSTPEARRNWRDDIYEQIREVMSLQGSLSLERMCQLVPVSRRSFYRSLARKYRIGHAKASDGQVAIPLGGRRSHEEQQLNSGEIVVSPRQEKSPIDAPWAHTPLDSSSLHAGRDDPSPVEAPDAGDKIEVPVPAQEWQRMLAAERRYPQIVRGNGPTRLFQLQADGRVGVSGFLVDVQNQHRSDPLAEPTLIACPVAGLSDAKPILAQDNHGHSESFRAGNKLDGRILAVGNG